MHGIDFSLPITNPVLIFALAMAIFLMAPLVMERLKVPGLIGLIAAGALVGPNGFHVLERGPTIVLLGTVGLIYLMFLAGIEIDLHGFRRYRGPSISFGLLTFLIPQSLGTALAAALGLGLPSAILAGALLASHTLLAYPLALRLGIAKNPAVTVAVGGTMIADTAALLVLAIVVASTSGTLSAAFWVRLAVSLAVFALLILLGLPWLARWFFRREQTSATVTFVFVMTALFVGAFLAEVAGVEPIVGAFLVGLALNRLIPHQGLLINRIHFVGEAFFIPFFLLSVGMLADVRVLLGGSRAWLVITGLAVVGVAAKWLASGLLRRLYDYSRAEGWTVFGLSVPRASATLAIALIGHDVGLFDDVMENGVIVLMLVTSFVGPWAVERYGRALALQEDLKPFEPAEAPHRILVPLSNPKTAPALMDLAILLREKRSREPVYALTVVPEEGDAAIEYVANAERMLSHAVAYAAGAEAPVLPLTRVDQNFASGIARGAVETRSTTLVVGWNGRASRQWIFGSTLDQLLEETKQLVVVAKLGHPLNVTKRFVLVVPPGCDHLHGFFDAAGIIKHMARRLGCGLHVLCVGTRAAPYQEEMTAVGPQVPLTTQEVSSWRNLLPALRETVTKDDLVVAISARRDTVAWHPNLARLPGQLARLLPESFLMVYPSEAIDLTLAPEVEHWPPHALDRLRIVPQLTGRSAHVVLDTLLTRQYPDNERRRREILRAVLHGKAGATIEIAPGVVIPHARLDVLDEPLLFLGVCPDGVTFPGTATPAHLVFLVLSPPDQANEHLAILGDVARLVADPGRVKALREAGTVAGVVEVLRSAPTPQPPLAG